MRQGVQLWGLFGLVIKRIHQFHLAAGMMCSFELNFAPLERGL